MFNFEPATQPTMYFIGVTTGSSSIMKVFPEWTQTLGLKNTVMKGIDIAIHAEPEVYRKVVQFLKDDPLSVGALVTTHKIDLYHACKDMFDMLDPYALQFGELSSISKRGAKLCGHAKDPITCGLALEEFVPKNYWKDHPEAGVFIMGAGGSAISMCSYFLRDTFVGNYPAKIVVANRSKPRLDKIEHINKTLLNTRGQTVCEYYLTPEPGQNDAVLHKMAPGSLIINATGLGKDRPGSPLTDAAVFPRNALVWEINYRGDLRFMHQGLEQKADRDLSVEDGWMYFIYGWTSVIAEVFDLKIEGKLLKECDRVAAKFNNR
jgi:shikimate dehydrogenase